MVWFGKSRSRPAGDPAEEGGRILTGDDRIDAPKVRILLDTIAELISSVEHRDVLRSIVDNAIRLVGAERGILFLFEDGDPSSPRIRVARDASGRDLEGPIRYSTTVVREVSQTGEARTWKVSSTHEEIRDLSKSVVDMRLTSVMCTQLRLKDRPLGVIYVDSRASHREFSRSDLRFFDALAGALAIAVENARLLREIVASERMKEQMEIARRIQEGLLPADPQDVPGFDVAGVSEAAEGAMGDYYDFIPVAPGRRGGEERLVVAVGDVAGHGIGPALLMSSARSLLRALTDRPFELPDVLARMNRRFERDSRGSHSSLFMSLFLCVLDPSDRTLVYGNAGHVPPFVIRRDGSVEWLERTGVALGIDPAQTYEQRGPLSLRPGDRLVAVTDGLVEARRGDETFGRDRLVEAVRSAADLPASGVLEALRRAVRSFAGEEVATDDMTAVVVRAL